MRVKKIYKPDSMKHAIECENFEEVRQGLDLDQEDQLVEYFIKIVNIRNDIKLSLSAQ